MGLPMAQVVSGLLTVPVGWGPSECEAEVQLEAARALGLEPQEVSFDWKAAPLSDGVVAQLQWVACAQSAVEQFNQCARRAGWQLASVEPELQAAHRAAYCLSGGTSVLLTRPVQDWQFDLALLSDVQAKSVDMVSPLSFDAELREALQTPAGPRLVAAGLALKAWT
jgi:Tfp pilus assembly PilM family ATPase